MGSLLNSGINELLILIGFIYIIYLHFKLEKKNEKINGIEAKMQELKQILGMSYLQSDTYYKQPKKSVHIFSDQILNFFQENINQNKIFLHYTKEKEVADKILEEGFRFAENFDKTAVEINKDNKHLAYQHQRYKDYGKYILVIAISREVYRHYNSYDDGNTQNEFVPEQLLTEKEPFYNDELDLVFTLHPNFIKGYIDMETGFIKRNPSFSPSYDSKQFQSNIIKH